MATKRGIVNTVGADPQQHGGLLSQAPLEGCREILQTADLPAWHTVGCSQRQLIAALGHRKQLIERSRRCRRDGQLAEDAAATVVDQQHQQWRR